MANDPPPPQLSLLDAPAPFADAARTVPRNAGRQRKPRPRAGSELGARAGFVDAAEVAVCADTDALTYGVPASMVGRVQVGCRVTVPVRGRLEVGVIWKVLPAADSGLPADALRPIAALLDDAPLWPAALCATLDVVARYHHSRLGLVVRTALPGPLRRTGALGDKAPVREVWRVARVDGIDWPVDLRKPERRILERLLALGNCDASALRRDVDPQTGRAKVVAVPQTMLEELAARGLLRLWQERQLRDPFRDREPPARDAAPVLSAAQQAAVARVQGILDTRQYQGLLLRGVTGSGKTEVYLGAIAASLARGRGAIVLVPEIALTPQLVGRFRARFGERVIALHSAMSDGDRVDALERVRTEAPCIVIGPRSALFAPMADIGVLVLDECHDGSFKQATGLRYHARDVALLLGHKHRAAVILGSATPSCEDWQLAQTGRLELVELPARIGDRSLPEAWVIDLREAQRLRDPDEPERWSMISQPLVHAIAETVAAGNQAIVLHNRRGFATSLVCRGCGASVECPRCAVTLVLHQRQRKLRCHLCDHAAPVEQPCVHCHATARVQVGAGTERIEQTLALALPGVRIERFDRDTAQGERMLDLLDRFRAREIDVLIGTQMLAKGHDFPSVTLVGVALAESGLDLPDFRAGERTFQLLTQVAGRAGRGDSPGRVMVQTFMPDHPAIMAALAQDHDAFLAHELEVRKRAGYPPFGYLALLETRHAEAARAESAMRELAAALRAAGADIRGPVPAGVARVRDVWRIHALLRDDDRNRLHGRLAWVLANARTALPAGVALMVDVDPWDFG